MTGFSLVTNVSASDYNRVRLMPQHWLAVFGNRIRELVFVLDRTPPSGRIKQQQSSSNGLTHSAKLARVEAELQALVASDARVRIAEIPTGAALADLTRTWFGDPNLRINRCQAGTPIIAFVAAFAEARERLVLRLDCDMLVFENGWLEAAALHLFAGRADLVEPGRCGVLRGPATVTTRALMLDTPRWRSEILPIRPHRLDPLRVAHRWLNGRPAWLALEQMLEVERQRSRLQYMVLDEALGYWLHVARDFEAALPIMPRVERAVRSGAVCNAQLAAGWDFVEAAWVENVE